MVPLISVVIPCFNSGKFINEAVASVIQCKDKSAVEIIIVNDGSTDQFTLGVLQKLSETECVVLHQENKGPAAARNAGVRQALCDYILFLDSDNLILPGYIEKGIQILQSNKKCGVVYGNPVFFGDSTEPRFHTGPFDKYAISVNNYIDICTVIRKQAWEDVGGLDENYLLLGHEDWEFWIHLISKNWEFHYLDEPMFRYRIREDSLLVEKSEHANTSAIISYVFSKHIELFTSFYRSLYAHRLEHSRDKKMPFRSLAKYAYNKYFRKSNGSA